MGDGPPAARPKIGLIAGNGNFPRLFAREARRHGEQVYAVGLKEEADAGLADDVDDITWLSVGQIGKTIDYFKRAGVTRAVMAGQVRHTQLFKDIVPDLRAAKILARAATRKAEALLSSVIEEFRQEGIDFLSSLTYLEPWLCPEGVLTRRSPVAEEAEDIAFARPLARLIAAHDIGQTLVVKRKTVVAVEAMEGTDACIRRAGQIAGAGTVVLKVARPRQDLRFDVPVVGPDTVLALREAGAAVLAMESRKTLLLEKDLLVETANAAGLVLQGLAFS